MSQTHQIAQTLRIERATQVAGADIWLHAIGGDTLVQLCEAAGGVPGDAVLAQARIPASAQAGRMHRVRWHPVGLTEGQECALVMTAGDTTTQIGIGQVGGQDADSGQYMGAQPHPIGALCTLGGDGQWVQHTDKALRFALLQAVYPNESQDVALGEISVTDASDLAVHAQAQAPEPGAGCTYTMALDDGRRYTVSADQRVELPAAYTGKVAVTATLKRGPRLGAVLLPGAVLVHGHLSDEADYITPWITAAGGASLRVEMLALIPAGAAVTVQRQYEGESTWTDLPHLQASSATRGAREMVFGVDGVSTPRLRVRLMLRGTPAARPLISNLRVVVV